MSSSFKPTFLLQYSCNFVQVFLYLNHNLNYNLAKCRGKLASCASGYILIEAEVPVPWNSTQAEFNPENLLQTFSKN